MAREPLSLAMTLKSKAKPIMPPAAHQWPLKAATVGRGKQQTLRRGFEPGTKEANWRSLIYQRVNICEDVETTHKPCLGALLGNLVWELQEMDH